MPNKTCLHEGCKGVPAVGIRFCEKHCKELTLQEKIADIHKAKGGTKDANTIRNSTRV
jgi:hypothetical protein